MVLCFIKSQCAQCNARFSCLANQAENCWCANYPSFLPTNPNQQCLCPSCLSLAFQQAVDKFISDEGLDKMLLKAAESPTDAEPIENVDFYMDNGNYVFTKWAHLKRGSCCGNGCTHCPYPQ